jgi:error-prone DNA polymerase
VVDQGLADHLLGLRGDRLPPGWSRPDERPVVRLGRATLPAPTTPTAPTPADRGGGGGRPVPPSGFDTGVEAPVARGSGGGRGGGGGRPVPPSGFDAGDAGRGYRFGVRVGLQDVRGITDDEIESLLDGRPFVSLEDVRARARLSRPTAEHLVRIGAIDHVAGVGRRGGPAGRRELLLAVQERWARAPAKRHAPQAPRPEQTALDLHADHELKLPTETAAERVRGEVATSGLDVSRHVVSFYEPLLEALGVVRANELSRLPVQKVVRVAGVKVAVQSPQQRSGQRVLFLSLDDRTGTTQATFFQSSLADTAWTVLHAWLLVVEGRVSRRGRLGATVNGQRAWDLSRLWRAWQEGWLPDALEERGTPAPHERTVQRPTGLHASEFGRGSR